MLAYLAVLAGTVLGGMALLTGNDVVDVVAIVSVFTTIAGTVAGRGNTDMYQ